LAQVAAPWLGGGANDVSLELYPFRNGLESAVARVVARRRVVDGRTRTVAFVVKQLTGRGRQEAAIYAHLAGLTLSGAPRVLAVEQGDNSAYLFLEYVRPAQSWPWRHLGYTALVLERLANLHVAIPVDALGAVVGSDYEARLGRSAQETLAVVERAAIQEDLEWLRPARRTVQKTVASLGAMRAALLNAEPFGTTLLHGDVHSGNVRIRLRGGAPEAVLLDWGRARFGSPLEDVASWLLSLGCWEPEAKRRHDTLLQRYLIARGLSSALDRDLRRAYWLAAASNVLAGALLYQVSVAAGWTDASARDRLAASGAARGHLRALRRAQALWSA